MVQTDEIILKVVAQFVFRPGSGQPTLLWLDSVHTVRSTAHYGDPTSTGIVDPHREFTKLTRELGEGSTSRYWTTFFPPKFADITSGGGAVKVVAGTCLSAESLRSDFLRKRLEQASFRQAGVAFNDAPSRSPRENRDGPFDAQKTLLQEEGTVFPENGTVPTAPNEAAGDFVALDGDPDEQGGDKIIPHDDGGEKRTSGNNDSNGGHKRGHFTLPTEAWALRSTAGRGLYFSRTGGAGGCGDRPVTEQWPRKRSTGTTMRPDGSWGRMDLRSALENQVRSWASPTSQAAGTGRRTMGAVGEPVGDITRRLTCTNG